MDGFILLISLLILAGLALLHRRQVRASYAQGYEAARIGHARGSGERHGLAPLPTNTRDDPLFVQGYRQAVIDLATEMQAAGLTLPTVEEEGVQPTAAA